MVNDLQVIVSWLNWPVVTAAAADEVADADDPAQDRHVVDTTDVMIVAVVVVAAVEADAVDDHFELNGQCWSKIFRPDAVGQI